MDIFSIITLIGGLAFFLYGMNVLSSGLERMAGGKLEKLLKKMTSNPIKGLLLGIGITAAIQSSSAVTVMLVGLVNSSIMTIGQSISVIMGSNIGTTATAWILTLVGIESDNVFMMFLKPENFSLVFAFLGILMIMGSKSSKKKDIGSILVGFAILMYGMKLMSSAVKPLSTVPEFTNLFVAFKNPIIGVLVGALVTAVIQSSSASVGILQALAMTGSVTYGAAIPIIMGQNIGTCVTALISSFGVNKNAKKVAVVHIAFNITGTILFLALFYILHGIFQFAIVNTPIDAVGIAVVHSVFNVLTTTALLPFTKLLEKLANTVMKDNEAEARPLIDERLIVTPSVAVAECDALTCKMAAIAKETLEGAIAMLSNYSEKTTNEIIEKEEIIDNYEDALGTYLVKVSSKKLSDSDSNKVSKMLHTIGNFERLGDHGVNILKVAKELHEKQLTFSSEAQKELSLLIKAIKEIANITTEAYVNNDIEEANKTEPLEQAIDMLVAELKARHIHRLRNGECSIELGFILSDLLGNFERIGDHYSNIAVSVIELSHNSFDTHKYLNSVKYGDRSFTEKCEEYFKKYRLE